MEPVMARKMWRTLEPYHGIIYFAPEATAAYEALGVMGFDGYFASRAALRYLVKALLTVGTGEHAGATIVGQARIHLAPGEARDPKTAIGKPSIGPDHWAQIYLAEAGQ